ncbi:hypothetical protein BgAZ_206620 [Babesia gibsoni]|uniref:DUF1279 domain-containing protein n=1 Tax=Babesia gibsoni TaxID=33632 RepID=A0AAD8URV2_BABGI|nr:hypothetical protein BgAZ_206620 [Babesia gibsoni]
MATSGVLAIRRIWSVAHQLRPCSTLLRSPAVSIRGGCVTRALFQHQATPLGNIWSRSGHLVVSQRYFSTPPKTTNEKESQSSTNASSKAEDSSPAKGRLTDVKSKIKLKTEGLRQKIAHNRAVARFRSRLSLFKISLRHKAKRKIMSSVALLKRYMKERRLRFGSIAMNPQRLQRMREMRKKIVEKSIAFRIFAAFAIKKYGKLGVGIYLGVYVATLLLMNVLTFNDYVTSNGLRKMLEKLHITHFTVPDIDSTFARFTVAYIATKALEPLRFIVSVVLILCANRLLKR